VTLQAHPDNDAALSLYEELGFEVVDRRADAYADGDALVLRPGMRAEARSRQASDALAAWGQTKGLFEPHASGET